MGSASTDIAMMAEAIREARRGLFSTTPNPRVGCILAHGNDIIARGFHHRAGEAHAEVNALTQAGSAARGATAYVSLEPCAHTGRTGPCAEALIAAEVARVVVAVIDPNPAVSGKGIAALERAGIRVDSGVLEAEATALNPGYMRRMGGGLPWVTLKIAMSLDGRTAMASGESQWITGAAARRDVQRLRARSCAVITGIGTVLADDPSLTVRDVEIAGESPRQPLRVVLDSQLRMSSAARMLGLPGKTLVAHCRGDDETTALDAAELISFGSAGHPDLTRLLRYLGERGCNEVMVEAGPTLAGAFMEAGLIDELVLYVAPTLLGSDARPMLALPLTTLSEQKRLRVLEQVRLGEDVRITARLLTR